MLCGCCWVWVPTDLPIFPNPSLSPHVCLPSGLPEQPLLPEWLPWGLSYQHYSGQLSGVEPHPATLLLSLLVALGPGPAPPQSLRHPVGWHSGNSICGPSSPGLNSSLPLKAFRHPSTLSHGKQQSPKRESLTLLLGWEVLAKDVQHQPEALKVPPRPPNEHSFQPACDGLRMEQAGISRL